MYYGPPSYRPSANSDLGDGGTRRRASIGHSRAAKPQLLEAINYYLFHYPFHSRRFPAREINVPRSHTTRPSILYSDKPPHIVSAVSLSIISIVPIMIIVLTAQALSPIVIARVP